MVHVAKQIVGDSRRKVPDIDPTRDDLSDDLLADVLHTLKSGITVYPNQVGKKVVYSRTTGKAVILADRNDAAFGPYWHIETSYPANVQNWGAPEGAGRLTFPATPNETSGASQTRPLDGAASQPSRNGLEVSSGPCQYRASPVSVQVATRKRRNIVRPSNPRNPEAIRAEGVPLFSTARINVDGIDRPTTNSNGQLIYPTEEGIRNFWRWFDGVRSRGVAEEVGQGADDGGVDGVGNGDTAGRRYALDEQGQPRVFYHGTRDSFDIFDLDHPNRKDTGWLGDGFYLGDDTRMADSYANIKRGAGDPNVMPLYAAFHNPYIATTDLKRKLSKLNKEGIRRYTDKLKALGHDSVVLTFKDGTQEVVVFEPTQIKSAIGNDGAFSPTNPDIRRSQRKTDEELAQSAAERVTDPGET